MNKLLAIFCFIVFALSAKAAVVKSAMYNTEKGTLEIEVNYSGGCASILLI